MIHRCNFSRLWESHAKLNTSTHTWMQRKIDLIPIEPFRTTNIHQSVLKNRQTDRHKMSPITDLTSSSSSVSSSNSGDSFPPAHRDLPGQQVQNLPPRDDAGIPTGVVIIIALFAIILVVAITCGILRLCKKEDHIEGVPSYSVAISNRLFKERSRKRKMREKFGVGKSSVSSYGRRVS